MLATRFTIKIASDPKSTHWSSPAPGRERPRDSGTSTVRPAEPSPRPPRRRRYSQAYYLSTTDASGTPHAWDFIGTVENFEADLNYVASVLRRPLDSGRPHKNSGLSKTAGREALRRAVLDDRRMACTLCHVYRLDYTCLGYDFPAECADCPDDPAGLWGVDDDARPRPSPSTAAAWKASSLSPPTGTWMAPLFAFSRRFRAWLQSSFHF